MSGKHLDPRETTCYGVYLGQRAALWDDVRVLPVLDFLKRLWQRRGSSPEVVSRTRRKYVPGR